MMFTFSALGTFCKFCPKNLFEILMLPDKSSSSLLADTWSHWLFLFYFKEGGQSFLRNSAHMQSSEELLWLLITAMKIISVFFLIKITEAIILFYMPFITDKHHYEAAFVFHLQKNFIARKTNWLFILLFTCSLKFKRLSNSGCKWFAEGDEATIFLSKERCSEELVYFSLDWTASSIEKPNCLLILNICSKLHEIQVYQKLCKKGRMLKNHWNTVKICLSGQTTKQTLSSFEPWKSWNYKQLWRLGYDPGSL